MKIFLEIEIRTIVKEIMMIKRLLLHIVLIMIKFQKTNMTKIRKAYLHQQINVIFNFMILHCINIIFSKLTFNI
jgi:hypothetical protein